MRARRCWRDLVGMPLCVGLSVFLVFWISSIFVAISHVVVAAVGAAAVLVFAAPNSRYAQPWPLLAGNLVSAVVGVSCARWIADPMLATGAALGLAMFAMQLLRCAHPPGGATAMIAVIGSEHIRTLGYTYVLMPIGLNMLLLLALIGHRLLGNPYPLRWGWNRREGGDEQ